MIDILRLGRKNALKKIPGREGGRRTKKKFILMVGAGRKRTESTLHFHLVRLTAISGHR
jgi:hypothetical protein